VTLIQTVAAPWGIWQCADHRLTALAGGALVDDHSIKQAAFTCTNGTALLGYSGIGQRVGRYGLADLSEWLRGFVGGESRSVAETVGLIGQQATLQLGATAAQLGTEHTFSIGAMVGGRAWLYVVSNLLASARLDAFRTIGLEVHRRPYVFVAGATGALSACDRVLLRQVVKRSRRHATQFGRILAEFNRRAAGNAKHGHLISPHCLTSYLPREGSVHSEMHNPGDALSTRTMIVPHLLFGIDLTDMVRYRLELGRAHERGTPQRHDEYARRAVDPEA
jgi:hypothetical protein